MWYYMYQQVNDSSDFRSVIVSGITLKSGVLPAGGWTGNECIIRCTRVAQINWFVGQDSVCCLRFGGSVVWNPF